MTVVADTNVIAYYLLRTEPFLSESAAFWRRGEDVWAPASWEIELTNVIWLSIRSGLLDAAEGLDRLRLAAQLGISSVPVRELWQGSLARASTMNHPAYDTVFVELATRLKCPLVTFDQSVLAKFPQVAIRPEALPAGRKNA